MHLHLCYFPIIFQGKQEEIPFDEEYSMNTNLHEDQFKFSGYTKSYLRYNKTSDEWRLTNYREEDTTWAIANGTDYPIGTHQWQIVSPSFTGLLEMNLNACNDLTEYNCHDGGCIHSNARHELFHNFKTISFYHIFLLAGVMAILIAMMVLMRQIVRQFILPHHIWPKIPHQFSISPQRNLR